MKKTKDDQPVVVIDVGNTSTSVGLYAGGRIVRKRFRPTMRTTAVSAEATLRSVLGRARPAGAVLGSVVPRVNAAWHMALGNVNAAMRVINVNPGLDFGVPVTYPKPRTIGADRLANACEAARRYGTPVIVADFGTAVTFDVISRAKGYIGGVIAPGLMLMFTYLHEKTALLPAIGPGSVRHPVGRSTEEAMRLGAIWGYRGLVREILGELKKGMREPRCRVCATGGYAQWVLKGSGMRIPVDPDLTLRGLGRIFELNA